jgi:hypothetical protein
MELLTYTGIWWLSDQANDTVAGTLTISNEEGFRLELIGRLGQIGEAFAINTIKTYPKILGMTKEGQQITLCDCLESLSHFSSNGAGTFASQQIFIRGAIYIGSHFLEPDDPRFYKIDVQYSHLQEWADLFKPQVLFTPGKFELTYTYPQKKHVSLSEGSISLVTTFNSHQNSSQVSLSQTVLIEFEVQEALTLTEWLSRYISPVQNFLSLATQRPNAIESISAYVAESKVDTTSTTAEKKPIQIIFPKYFIEKKAGETIHPHNMLFAYVDIEADFSEIIKKWLAVSDELSSVCDLFFSVMYNRNLYQENRFLNIAQAAETYHRRRFKKDVPGDEHVKRLAAILASAPEEYREWLEKKLTYSHEPNLSQRLKDLIREVDKVIKPLLRRKDSFVQKVVDTRNFLTHYDPSLENKAAKGEALFVLTQTLSLLVQACFLHELGLSDEKSIEFFGRSSDYKFVLSKK